MGLRDIDGKPPSAQGQPEDMVFSRRSLLRLPGRGTAAREIDFDSVHERVLRGWESGPHTELLRATEPASEVLVEVAGIEPADELLDVGAGDGNLALAAARAGADVYACDASPAMVERGRIRSQADGGKVAWRLADVSDLPYPDDHFDAVLSSFGASYAPRALRAAREVVRVARPGGVVGLAAWVARGLPGRLDELVETVAPLPDGVRKPSAWGQEEVARRRLGPLLEELEVRSRTVRMHWDSPDAAFESLVAPFALDDADEARIRPDFDRLLASCNNRPPEVELDARYLIVLGRVPD